MTATGWGFALQLTTVRYLGTFLDDPIDVPSVVLDGLAAQMQIADASCVKTYVERVNTKWEHRREIAAEDGWREFAEVRDVFVSDTGSYSDMVFGLLKLLGVDYRPELAGLPDQKLWRIDPAAEYGPLDAAARGKIDLAKIKRYWSDIFRIVASVHRGAISASDVMRMLQHGDPAQLGDALTHFGRIFKTLHVLSYADREGYRRDIKWIRNLQEERHGLAKHVFHGRKGELREAYHAGMEDQLGALGLVVNAITLWNTVYLDRILGRLRADGYPVREADVARLHPYWHKHVNVAGHYSFTPPDLDGDGRRALRDPDQPDPDEG